MPEFFVKILFLTFAKVILHMGCILFTKFDALVKQGGTLMLKDKLGTRKGSPYIWRSVASITIAFL